MRIEFKLNENEYAIDVDNVCYTALKLSTVKSGSRAGQVAETSLGYCSKLSSAALKCLREEIGQSTDTVTLKEYASRVEALNKQLTDQLDAISV